MRSSFRSSMLSIIAGFIAMFLFLWLRASAEIGYITWLSFYLTIACGLLSAHLLRIRLEPFIVFLPLFSWHLCWLLFYASSGNLNAPALMHLSVIITLSTAIFFVTRKTRRKVRR